MSLSPKEVLVLYRTLLRYSCAAVQFHRHHSNDLRRLWRREANKWMALAKADQRKQQQQQQNQEHSKSFDESDATWEELRLRGIYLALLCFFFSYKQRLNSFLFFSAKNTLEMLAHDAHHLGPTHKLFKNVTDLAFFLDPPHYVHSKFDTFNRIRKVKPSLAYLEGYKESSLDAVEHVRRMAQGSQAIFLGIGQKPKEPLPRE
jgi:hypothetical protein